MNSKERLLAAWNGLPTDHLPLTTWCFGFKPPPYLTWQRHGRPVEFWYSLRLEHIHTLPQPWQLEDDFQRVLAWQSLGVDDLLDVSVPWSVDPGVSWQDALLPADGQHPSPRLARQYQTLAGSLRHVIRQTGEDPGAGWVIQPDYAALFEDYNIPRAEKHIVSRPEDAPAIAYLYRPPDAAARGAFAERMRRVAAFAARHGVAVQAWSAFGMDAVVWLAGAQGAILLAMDAPQAFGRLVDIIAEADYGRSELALTTPGVDMVVQRGWYSSTDFWSPKLFDSYVFPHLKQLCELAHRHGKKFAYVMTTGVEKLGPRLAAAGVDVLYFVDPLQDRFPLENARRLLGEGMALVGGLNVLTLAPGDRDQIRESVRRAIDSLAPGGRFILHPLDSLFPDTPWEGVEALIEAWKEFT
jgi:hypothetical protein